MFGLSKAAVAAGPFHKRSLLQFSPKQMYDVVSQVQHYKHFVPYCVASDVISVSDDGSQLEADLTVKYLMLTEKYRSKVTLHPAANKVVAVSNNTNLFDNLQSVWTISKGFGPNSCWVDFSIDYKFKSSVYETIAKQYFENLVKNNMTAFENRCKLLYKK